jgi:D-tagatose-bisphosphate aldolase class II non-catalytic subunit
LFLLIAFTFAYGHDRTARNQSELDRKEVAGKVSEQLQRLLANRKNESEFRGIYSVCSAHPWVLQAAMQQAKASGGPLLIEATSNQVNQFCGCTGMQPADFYRAVFDLAQQEQFPVERLILGGDHLGPNPWQHLPAVEAMAHAETMVVACAAAGFTKLHLDASMPCAGDPSLLPDAVVAERAARLCSAAEQAPPGKTLLYIIGTEVPTPGGATEDLGHMHVTTKHAALQTLEVHERVFAEHGLTHVWPRVVAVVVQPGVEFNHDSVVFYQADKATDLVTLLADRKTLVFEAHSTDYQLPSGYQELVRDGFAILKVGPALTFAMRDAEIVSHNDVVIEPPPEPCVKLLCTIDVRNRDERDLELHVEACFKRLESALLSMSLDTMYLDSVVGGIPIWSPVISWLFRGIGNSGNGLHVLQAKFYGHQGTEW